MDKIKEKKLRLNFQMHFSPQLAAVLKKEKDALGLSWGKFCKTTMIEYCLNRDELETTKAIMHGMTKNIKIKKR